MIANNRKIEPPLSTLKKHQHVMLTMLLYVDRVCQKHNIKYWLSSGTLLGAVRHKGFIPWDDDLDIEMLRPDFERFIDLAISEGEYNMQCQKTDPYYMLPYAKLRDKNSFIEEHGQDRNYKYRGIYIDIFCFEPSSQFAVRLVGNTVWHIHNLGAKQNKHAWSCYPLLRQLYFIYIHTIKAVDKLLKTRKEVRYALGSVFDKTRDLSRIFPLRMGSFEGYEFPIPNDCDFYLKEQYGDDYMIPKQFESAHHTSHVKFFNQ